MRSFVRRSIFFILSFILSSLNAHASSLVRSSTRELSAKAGWVGRIQIIQTRVEKRGLPYEIFEARILEIFKGRGEVGQFILFSRPGGTIGRKSVAVMGSPVLTKDKDYIVFLDEDPLFQYRDQSAEVQLEGWTAFEVLPGRDGEPAQVVRPGSVVAPRASRAYQRSSTLGYGSVAVGPYSDLVTEIYRGLD